MKYFLAMVFIRYLIIKDNTVGLEALWDDLYEAYQNKTVDNGCYFLGSIVVVNDGKGYFELIDGQKRITTLMILMNVLVKDFPEINKNSDEIFVADKDKIQNCILFQGRKNRLQLQTDPKYDSIFNDLIINCESFADIDEPTKKELKLDDPQYKYINSAVFFYKKLSELNETELDEFVNYIFYSTNIIKIECTNQSFAIKLFQVLNDRGLELSPSDIVKSYIIGKYKQNDEWNYIKDEEVLPEINGLGNMALLQDIKNEEALNCGFDRKIRIYKGQDEEGNNKSGITSFEFTRKIIEYYDSGNTTWNIDQILERKKYLISKIEEMLEISREDINLKLPEESTDGKTGKSKWLYKNVYYDNAKLVRALIQDYIVDKN